MRRSRDFEAISTALKWLDSGDSLFSVTLARSRDAASRHTGLPMIIHPGVSFVGSVRGGCVGNDPAPRVRRGKVESGLIQARRLLIRDSKGTSYA